MEILDELSKGKSLKDLLDSVYVTQHAAELQPNPKGHRTLGRLWKSGTEFIQLSREFPGLIQESKLHDSIFLDVSGIVWAVVGRVGIISDEAERSFQ